MTPSPQFPETILSSLGRVVGLEEALQLAIRAAEYSRGVSTPNPPVGAVILDAAHHVCGIGCTQPPGGPHAEIEALRMAGAAAQGGTAVVTLEPCNSWGRTGPCSHALEEAGIASLHYAFADNTSFGGGAQYLTAHGVTCTQGDDAQRARVREGGLGAWLHKQETGKPRVTVKMAATLDGFSAAADGTSQWITGEAARADAHVERARVDAIIVGTGTLRTDNPALTARDVHGELYPHQPHRYVVGSSAIPGEVEITHTAGMPICAITEGYAAAPLTHLRTRHWDDVLAYFADTDYQDVLVEGGPRIVGDLLAQGYTDRILMYTAPMILGQGLSAAYSPLIDTLPDAQRFQFVSCERVGEDLKLILERKL